MTTDVAGTTELAATPSVAATTELVATPSVVDTSHLLLVGVDVGGTKIAVLVTTPDGAIVGRSTTASSAGDQDGAAEAIATTVEAALADAGASVDDVAVIGVGVPGRVDPRTGRVTIAVNLGWTDLALRDALEARLGRPCVIENDARAAAVGLHHRRVLGNAEDIAYLAVGTGIAAGVILDGRLHRGARGLAGEIGHAIADAAGPVCTCGQRGCLEALVSGPSIARRAAEALAMNRGGSRLRDIPLDELTAVDVYRAAATGDPLAADLVENVGRQLAWAIHLLVMAYDVDRVVVGGGVSHAGETFMAPIRRELDRLRAASPVAGELLAPDVVESLPIGADAGVLGAVAIAQQALHRDGRVGARTPARTASGQPAPPRHRAQPGSRHSRATHRRGRRCVTPDRHRRPSGAARSTRRAPTKRADRGERGGAMRHKRAITFGIAAILAVGACANPAASEPPTAAPTEAPSTAASEAPATSAPSGPNAELTAALAGDYSGKTVDVFAQWIEAEGQSFDDSLKAFRDATGINVVYSGITNYETVLGVRVSGGLAPDVAQIAQPGTMRNYQKDGKLVALDEFIDLDSIKADFNPSFVDLGTVEGKLYGLFYKQDLKSIVWYPVKAFADKGYTVPTTWDELVALSDKIVADGSNPWCTTIEHGDASGWVATDWLEDIILRTAGADVYDQWVNHEIPFNDPAILAAAEIMSKMWFTEDYVYGGNTRINATWVGDSQTPMFDEGGPKCWLHKQAAWIPDFWPKDADGNALFKAGVDSSFFYFPPIEPAQGNPVLGGGDMFVMFNDRPEVRAFVEWLSTVDAVKDRVATGAFLAANNAVPADWYTSYPMSGLAEIAREATALRFDGSDSMPKEVGAGTFWKGMVKWVAQNGEGTEQIFADIEASWP